MVPTPVLLHSAGAQGQDKPKTPQAHSLTVLSHRLLQWSVTYFRMNGWFRLGRAELQFQLLQGLLKGFTWARELNTVKIHLRNRKWSEYVVPFHLGKCLSFLRPPKYRSKGMLLLILSALYSLPLWQVLQMLSHLKTQVDGCTSRKARQRSLLLGPR